MDRWTCNKHIKLYLSFNNVIFFLNYSLLTCWKITIFLALMIFIIFIFPIADLKIFSSCNVIQQIKKSGFTIGNSKVTLKVLSLFVQLQLKVVKGSNFIKYSPEKASVIWQQLKFNYLYSQHRIMLILFPVLEVTQCENWFNQCHISPNVGLHDSL